jgi:hypothetical protein
MIPRGKGKSQGGEYLIILDTYVWKRIRAVYLHNISITSHDKGNCPSFYPQPAHMVIQPFPA